MSKCDTVACIYLVAMQFVSATESDPAALCLKRPL